VDPQERRVHDAPAEGILRDRKPCLNRIPVSPVVSCRLVDWLRVSHDHPVQVGIFEAHRASTEDLQSIYKKRRAAPPPQRLPLLRQSTARAMAGRSPGLFPDRGRHFDLSSLCASSWRDRFLESPSCRPARSSSHAAIHLRSAPGAEQLVLRLALCPSPPSRRADPVFREIFVASERRRHRAPSMLGTFDRESCCPRRCPSLSITAARPGVPALREPSAIRPVANTLRSASVCAAGVCASFRIHVRFARRTRRTRNSVAKFALLRPFHQPQSTSPPHTSLTPNLRLAHAQIDFRSPANDSRISIPSLIIDQSPWRLKGPDRSSPVRVARLLGCCSESLMAQRTSLLVRGSVGAI